MDFIIGLLAYKDKYKGPSYNYYLVIINRYLKYLNIFSITRLL